MCIRDSIRLLRAIQEVALSAGVQGMVVGQVLDLSADKAENPVNLMGLQQIHRYKTGALFASAIISAGILAGANQEELQALRGYANAFGLAFQIEDDILDVIGDAKKLGKPIGSDEKNQKVTYPLLLGLEGSKEAARKAAETAIRSIEPLGAKANRLQELVTFLLQREY